MLTSLLFVVDKFSELTRYISDTAFSNKSHKHLCQVVLSSSSKYFKDFFRHQPGVNIIDLDKVKRGTSNITIS